MFGIPSRWYGQKDCVQRPPSPLDRLRRSPSPRVAAPGSLRWHFTDRVLLWQIAILSVSSSTLMLRSLASIRTCWWNWEVYCLDCDRTSCFPYHESRLMDFGTRCWIQCQWYSSKLHAMSDYASIEITYSHLCVYLDLLASGFWARPHHEYVFDNCIGKLTGRAQTGRERKTDVGPCSLQDEASSCPWVSQEKVWVT